MSKLILAALFCTSCLFSGEADTLAKITTACQQYVNKKVPHNQVVSWCKKMSDKILQKMQDSQATEQVAADTILIDWVADHKKDISSMKPLAVKECCLLLLYYSDRSWDVPAMFKDNLEPAKAQEILDFLTSEIMAL